jgi:hypothetical protein
MSAYRRLVSVQAELRVTFSDNSFARCQTLNLSLRRSRYRRGLGAITSLDPADSQRRGKTNILRKGFDVKADIFSNQKAPCGADVEKNDCS